MSTTAHRNSILNAQGFTLPLRMEDHLFQFDNVEFISARGLAPLAASGLVLHGANGRYGDGVGVYDGQTNLITNGNFENGLTGWGKSTGGSAVADATIVPHGRMSQDAILFRATATGTWIVYHNNSFQSHVFDTTKRYALGFWYKAYDGDGFYERNVSIRRSDGSNVVMNNVAFTPTDKWQYFEHAFNPLAAGSTPQLYITDGLRLNAGFLICEAVLVQNDVARPYFSGTVPGASLSYDISHMHLKDKGGVACWIRNSKFIRDINNSKAENIYPLKLTSLASSDFYADMVAFAKGNGESKVRFWSTGGGGGTTRVDDHLYPSMVQSSIPERDWFHVVMQWDKAGLPSGFTKELYINGVLQGAVSTTDALPQRVLTRLFVGTWDGSYGRPQADFSDLVVSRRTFTDDEIDLISRSGSSLYDPYDVRIIV